MKKIIIALIVLAVLGLGFYFVRSWYANRLYNDPNFAYGNGRVEATEINIAARLAGKVEKVNVLEGEKVKQGQVLVIMQTNVLVANLAQAEAKREQTIASEAAANAKVAAQIATLEKMKSDLERTKAVEANAKTQMNRYKELLKTNATSRQHFETAETAWLSAQANRMSSIAAIKETEANILVAKADVKGAKANIIAAEAEISRIKADIDDSLLKSPLAGRIQYRVAEPGEVLSAGGRALNMVDLTDVYMTFFLPEQLAGKVKIGSEVRIVLDALPDAPLPARVSYIASVAQFTPKTIETRVERQKLMFRVKAHIDRELLEEFIDIIKTGLPGVAWVKLNDRTEWPKELQVSEQAKARIQKAREFLKTQGVKAPSAVIRSQTRNQAQDTILPEAKELKKKAAATTQAGREEIAVKAAVKINSKKTESVDRTAAQAKKVQKAKETDVSKAVEKVRNNDAKAKNAR